MPIFVVCPGCRKRFEVSDKFAGMTGPCPSCKVPIKIPTKKEEVKIHEPEQFASGGRSAAGHLVLKPVAHKDAKFNPTAAAAIAAGAVVVLAVAFLGQPILRDSWLLRAIGLLAVSPPLVMAGYWFLANDELEPYRGAPLYVRCGVLALLYAATWGLFSLGFVQEFVHGGELWVWLVVLPPLLLVGALTALACLDLDFGSAFFHYAFYVLVTMLVGWAAGMGWPWQTLARTGP